MKMGEKENLNISHCLAVMDGQCDSNNPRTGVSNLNKFDLRIISWRKTKMKNPI